MVGRSKMAEKRHTSFMDVPLPNLENEGSILTMNINLEFLLFGPGYKVKVESIYLTTQLKVDLLCQAPITQCSKKVSIFLLYLKSAKSARATHVSDQK